MATNYWDAARALGFEQGENSLDELDDQDVIFVIAGEKLDPESEDGVDILTAYQEGYEDGYDNRTQD